MWEHYCEEEKCIVGMEIGRPCDWCEKTQSELPSEPQTGQNTPIQE